MDIKELLKAYSKREETKALSKAISLKKCRTIGVDGLAGSACALVFASIADKIEAPVLFILRDEDEAGYFYHDLCACLTTEGQEGDDAPLFFPSSYKRAVKYGHRDAANEILRTEVLSRIGTGRIKYIVTSPVALAEMVVSKKLVDDKRVSIAVGEQVEMMGIVHRLQALGFKTVDYVYEPGQMAVRGSLLDVYSFSCELPFRVDFFGNEVDTIRTFEVETQLSKERKDRVEILPEVAVLEGDKMPLTEYLPDETVIVTKDMKYIAEVVGRTFEEGFSSQAMSDRMAVATEMEQAEIRREMNASTNLCTRPRFEESVRGKKVVLTAQVDDDAAQATVHFHTTPQPLFHKNFELLAHTVEDYLLQGYRFMVLADSQKQVERLKSILYKDDTEDNITLESVNKTLHEGFVDNDSKLCLFTDHQIFERFHKYNLKTDNARRGKMALTMKELQEMEPGDFIVHVDFGIGKFAGLVRVPVGDAYQEVIRIMYKAQRGGDASVDVGIHSLHKVSKYRKGNCETPPQMNVLGTGAWDRLKEKAKKRIKDIARDLIKLYAKRRHEKGFQFAPDNYLQHELEGSFLYEDTPDQMKATADVKHDMESKRPMDRLVCGDVGFGKTEVAIRAAFKAACDSKQTAVLVPTTVLAFQHYQTFKERMKNLPVRVEYLSRARTAKQTREILKDLEEGKIDILVGTHKLIAKSVKWKDIGLLIIDEEQKFGVSVKEKLRQLKTNIDTLTMSATPIPRTLQFSLMGARDMSIMRTPPPNRHPIMTEVTTFSTEVICDAINFEMSRNGQVYIVNDRIAKLDDLRRMIERHIPDCRVAIGHGQMKPEELEKTLMGFMAYDYDVLISTTIVENGIDVGNANTIIINGAHHFGLSDLHQMRGRVGRSNRKAFCYLIAPPLSLLPTDSRRRLEALETFSDLGSGFNIAMQDLDIRGAGNLLGSEQSGFMEDLGYETYQKILSQAVNELKNDEFQTLFEEQLAEGETLTGDDFVDDCGFESDLEMFFPDLYVPGSSERMLLYRELDNIETDAELDAYRKRLEDRFGPVPREGEELMQVVPLRRLGKSLGCEKITLSNGVMKMQFVSNTQSVFFKSDVFTNILDFVATHPKRCLFREDKNGKRILIIKSITRVSDGVDMLRRLKGDEAK